MKNHKQLEELQFLSHLYKDPYCNCDLYAKGCEKLRVFQIENKEICEKLLPILMDEQVPISFLGETLCMIVPYEEGENLLLWKQQDHSMKERILLCREILFHVIAADESDDFQRLYLEAGNLEINNSRILYFQHPNFSRFLHEKEACIIPQHCAQLFYEILEEDASVHKRNFLKNPKELQQFHRNILWKRYRSFDALMSDLSGLLKAYEQIKNRQKEALHYIFLGLICCVTVLLLVFGYLEYQEQKNQRYDGIQNIGSEELLK